MSDNPGYKTKDGKRLPRVTTIIGQLDKPGLLHSAVALMKEGKDHKAEWAIKRDAGTWCHYMIGLHLGLEEETPEVGEESLSLGACAYENWQRWWAAMNDSHRVTPIDVERKISCDVMGVGGTPDLVAEIDGVLTVLDWKTSGKPKIYEAAAIQLAAYMEMWSIEIGNAEYGFIEQAQVVSIPTLAFADVVTSKMWTRAEMAPALSVFGDLLTVHSAMRDVRKMVKPVTGGEK